LAAPRPATGPRSRSTGAIGTTRSTCSWHSSGAIVPAAGCQDEPGESIDSLAAALPAAATADRAGDLEQELDSLSEEIEDLEEPVAEFDQFDECMYLIGVSAYGRRDGAFGYHFGTHGRARRPALALDLRPSSRPRYRFLAFPGEEPPSIECNEDAGEEIVDN
jgi:hypothetical protein